MSGNELRKALKQETANKTKKTPGGNGICHKFYAAFWEHIESYLLKMYNMILRRGSLDDCPPPTPTKGVYFMHPVPKTAFPNSITV
jgi:hypothetical protein